jgi:sugar-specific transcriptional regulator TrmB
MTDRWIIESLKKLGLTEYEARTYIALNRIKAGTVYDINVTSDIPRSAIYGSLSKLEEKGLIEVEHGKPMRYRSIIPAKAINKLRSSINDESEKAITYLEEAYTQSECPEPTEAMWTIRGIMNLYNKSSDMIGSADKTILFITTDPLFDNLAQHYPVFNNIFQLVQRRLSEGVRVRLVCLSKAAADYILSKLPAVEVRMMDLSRPSASIPLMSSVLMTDDSEVLLSIIGDGVTGDHKDITTIHTREENIISVFRHFMEVEWDSAIAMNA